MTHAILPILVQPSWLTYRLFKGVILPFGQNRELLENLQNTVIWEALL